MTYQEIENRIVADLNRSDITASIVGWVNDVYNDILSRREWQWLNATAEVNTVVDQYRYELPSDYGDVKSLVIVDGTNAQSIPYITVEEFDLRYPEVETDTTNTPEVFTVRHGITPAGVHYDEINTYPRANLATYVMRMWYSINAPALSGALVPVIPPLFHSVLVFGGLEMGFARLREYDAAAYWMKKKDMVFINMVENDKKFPSQGQMKPFRAMQTTLPGNYWLNHTVTST
jgi:hypothetical protein